MNVIWCVVDCLRYDALSINNYHRPTSTALDERLKTDFITFEDACSQSAFTLSVLSSLITGTYPSTHSALQFNDQLPRNIPTMGEMNEGNGEIHSISGMNFIDNEWGLARPFDSIHNLDSIKSNRESSQARANEIRKKAEDVLHNHDDITALLWFFDLHTPWLSDRTFSSRNHSRDHYDTELKFTSSQIEQLCKTLESRGEYDDSMVILTGDHGDLFRESNKLEGTSIPSEFGMLPGMSKIIDGEYQGHLGRTLSDELLHVPLYIKLPDNTKGGYRFNGQVELIDILPTILDVQGNTPAESIEGKSLLSTLESGSGKKHVFAEIEATVSTGRFQTVRSKQYNFTHHTPPDKFNRSNPVTYAIRRWLTKQERFVARVDERRGLSTESDIASRLRRALQDWQKRSTADEWQDTSRDLSDDQRKELESLGYL